MDVHHISVEMTPIQWEQDPAVGMGKGILHDIFNLGQYIIFQITLSYVLWYNISG